MCVLAIVAVALACLGLPLQAPWPKDTTAMWHHSGLRKGTSFEISEHPGDLGDHCALFWTHIVN